MLTLASSPGAMNPALEYHVHGPQQAPWLTLSHPIGVNLHIWDAQIARLARHYRVLAFSTRGHGGSPGDASDAWTMDDLARDVQQLWRALGIQRSHFLGLSLGGCIGVALALQTPQSVRSLIVACSRLEMDAPASDMWRQRASLVEQQGMAPLIQPTLERWFTPDFLTRAPAAVQPVRQMLAACPPRGFAGAARALAGLHLESRLDELRVPTLYLGGRHDQAVAPGQLEAYAARSPGAHFAALDGPHILHLENPDGFGSAVLDFLDQH